MKRALRFLLAVAFVPTSLLGCGSTEEMMAEVNPLDGVACVGMVDPVPSGLAPIDDPQLLNDALGKSGDGKLCYGQVFTATAPVTVYRVWNSAKSYTEFGKWWSLMKPTGPVDAYRNANAICPEWSDLNQLTQCTIKVGSHVVVGPGQSANCMMMMYGKSAVNQVYMANDTRVGMLYVENCTQLGAWP